MCRQTGLPGQIGIAKPIPPDLTVSIINHSNPEMLLACLRSLYASTHYVTLDVWVVDNATDGRLVADIKYEFPNVRWIVNTRRQGFSANHNLVLKQAAGRYVCILNDDTIIHDGAFDCLVRYMDVNPGIGVVGARLVNMDGSAQRCAFKFPSLWSELADICLVPASLNGLKSIGIHPAQYAGVSAPVDWVLGACIVMRAEALRQIGVLDSGMSPIANTEEVDWCYRARQGGWAVAYCPDATITHFGGRSQVRTHGGVDRLRVEMYRTRIAFFRKHHGALGAGLLRLIYVVTLPWNVLMLTQSVLRRRLAPREFRSYVITLSWIAALSALTRGRFSPWQ